MENFTPLLRHGLFDAKVPRYTSYPPANHFENDVGLRHQSEWLAAVQADEAVSLYIHIPFCKRLCWFCACRTQGTSTLRPVATYVDVLRREIAAVRATLPAGIKMGRLHLGGGTPTILSPDLMRSLLDEVFCAFQPSNGFEFSVEIDPTDATPALLNVLIDAGMNRASIGVQDFAPDVQAAIGRLQSLEETTAVIGHLRKGGIAAINLDLLYGLPFQTCQSFQDTLDHVIAMQPDRLAIYGYAHVPWMSKRQVLIKPETLPDTKFRFELANMADARLGDVGFEPIGIDHFAMPHDSLCHAHHAGTLKRNFQGYTDDPSDVLIGFGASAISKFPGGYMQNAVATSAYQERIEKAGFAGHKGYVMNDTDQLISRMIEELMCRFRFPTVTLQAEFPAQAKAVRAMAVALMARYTDVISLDHAGLVIRDEARPLVRIIANYIDTFTSEEVAHASAI